MDALRDPNGSLHVDGQFVLAAMESPGATITYTEAGVAAGDIVWASGALSAPIGYEIGTVAYDHMDVQTQDAIGGTIDAALYNMTEAWDLFLQEY